MSATRADANSDCIALALAFFHAPSAYPDLLHGRERLPKGMGELLLAAAGNSRADSSPSPFAGTSEQQEAALFFIEQVLLAHNATHYRVLGLEPDAGADAIKEHYRLLMRLFHPDRQTTPDERTDALATRINQAYSVLRSRGARADYDRSLQQKHPVQPPSRQHSWHPTPAEPLGLTGVLPPFVVRHLAPFMLAGIAALVALGVLLVYVNQPPKGAIGSGSSGFSQAPVVDHPVAPPRHVEPERLAKADADSPASEPSREPLPSPHEPPPAATAPSTARPSPARIADPASDPMRSAAAGPARGGAGVARDGPARALPEATSPLPAAIGAPVAVDPPKVPEFKPPSPRPEQLNSLLARFSELYQRGDLESLLELFDASARIERGDRTQIRAEYGDLFRNSEGRTLYVWDVAWSAHGDVTRGEGQFQARVLQKGERSPRVYNGTLTIDAIQRNDRPLIVGLYHKTGN